MEIPSYVVSGFDEETLNLVKELDALGGGDATIFNAEAHTIVVGPSDNDINDSTNQTLWVKDNRVGFRNTFLSKTEPIAKSIKYFTFDSVTKINDIVNNPDSYHIIEVLKNHMINGFNGTVIAVGEKGTGKTRVLFGAAPTSTTSDIPRIQDIPTSIVSSLLRQLYIHKNNSMENITIALSVWTIKGSQLVDLLSPSSLSESLMEFAVIECENLKTAIQVISSARDKMPGVLCHPREPLQDNHKEPLHFFLRIILHTSSCTEKSNNDASISTRTKTSSSNTHAEKSNNSNDKNNDVSINTKSNNSKIDNRNDENKDAASTRSNNSKIDNSNDKNNDESISAKSNSGKISNSNNIDASISTKTNTGSNNNNNNNNSKLDLGRLSVLTIVDLVGKLTDVDIAAPISDDIRVLRRRTNLGLVALAKVINLIKKAHKTNNASSDTNPLFPARTSITLTPARESTLTSVLTPMLVGNCKLFFMPFIRDGVRHSVGTHDTLALAHGVNGILSANFKHTGVSLCELKMKPPNHCLGPFTVNPFNTSVSRSMKTKADLADLAKKHINDDLSILSDVTDGFPHLLSQTQSVNNKTIIDRIHQINENENISSPTKHTDDENEIISTTKHYSNIKTIIDIKQETESIASNNTAINTISDIDSSVSYLSNYNNKSKQIKHGKYR